MNPVPKRSTREADSERGNEAGWYFEITLSSFSTVVLQKEKLRPRDEGKKKSHPGPRHSSEGGAGSGGMFDC